jgi:hypothetical protein
MMLLQHACQWLADSWVGTSIRESDNLFSIIETVHVLGVIVTAGTIAIVDLRILGVLMARYSVAQVLQPLVRITWLGFAVMVVSGFLLFWSEADKLYVNSAFRLKVLLLLLAGLNQWIFHATAYRQLAAAGVAARIPPQAKFAASLSLALWSGVIVLGRAIAYL